ncbi:hypothetical protein NDU88_003875 [Pleurodeles waltl]|uniref:Reverse transcriptase/retrotransposon-derived protein RNase H-like domain-containing protein n=1 Tax=Pleurodeles waltl TaxID=8319 RepID=A0AAV7NMU0_PLEWA|nr:hypothetical protein NDU88_003875 [Pleurodeles waltl]
MAGGISVTLPSLLGQINTSSKVVITPKVSPLKLQYCQKSVKHFGHQIEKGSRRISRERITMILQRSPLTSQRDVRMFLRMVGYCRQWIPNFADIAKPLQQLTHKDVTDPITLDEDQMKAFTELRESLCRAPALGMPDYTKPFTLFCHECDACSLSVLTQVHGDAFRPVAYFSATLEQVAAALQGCLRAVAAVYQSLSRCEGVVMAYPLTVMVPRSVEILLKRTKTQYLTGARLTSHTKRVVCPQDHEEVLLKVPTTVKRVTAPESEKEPTEPEIEPELVEDGSITPVRDKSEEFQEGLQGPISTDIAREPSSAEVLPEADGAEKQSGQVLDQEGERVEADQSQTDLTPPEPVAGPSRQNTIEKEKEKSPILRRILKEGTTRL